MATSGAGSDSTPSPEDKATVEALVAGCIEAMERGERDPASRICSDRPDLLTKVQRRLAHLAKHGLIPEADAMPQAIGPYRIVRELGSGGMGSVYLAEQSVPVRRRVALKVVKLGMDTREVVARFQAERQALAQMNHPHIAQVFDAGITAEGRPFFAMEYVEGESLTDLCDRRALTTEQRVALLAVVCRAIQHAHDRGFIHRDLKPSNVLVAEHEGELAPKVIDFGIAKATAAAIAAATVLDGPATRVDQVLGTPEYMSPEQARSGGLDVDTRTDVYSLGVILYELLCGELPFDSRRLRRASRHEMERILLDELPTLPSKRLSLVDGKVLAARRADRTTLQRRVAGELDWITLKAIHKQPDQRYPSALAFAEDLERWQRREPVLAAPPGRTYRLRKFVQRHRVVVLASAAVLLALVVGLVVSLRAAADARTALQKEERALADMRTFYGFARDALGVFVDAADQGLADVPQADVVRKQLLASALHHYERLREHQPDDPELRIDLVAANLRIGVLQRRLGQTDAAIAVLQQCERDLASLPRAVAENARTLALSIDVPAAVGRTLGEAGRSAAAKQAYATALQRLQAARQVAATGLPDADQREAGLLANLAVETGDDVPAAIDLFTRAMAAYARAGSADAVQRRDRARCATLLAEALTKQNRLDDAAALLADATTQLGDTASPSALHRETEARVRSLAARVLRRLGRLDEARAAQQRAIDLRAQLAVEHPDVLVHAEEEADGLQSLASLAIERGAPEEALAPIDRAIQLREQLAARRPEDPYAPMRIARALVSKGEVLTELWQHHGRDAAPAVATYRAAAAIADASRQRHPDDVEIVLTFAAVHEALAALLEAGGDSAKARAEHTLARTHLEELRKLRPTNPDVLGHLALVCSNLAYSQLRSGEWDAAIAAGDTSLECIRSALALDARHRQAHALVPQLLARLSAAHFGRGDPARGLATVRLLVETPQFDDEARDWGALLLAEHALKGQTDGSIDADLERAAVELRKAIDRRGPLAAMLDRPGERAGASHGASRQRDFDLRALLADVLADLDEPDAQAKVLAEALELAKGMPGLSTDRRRNVFGQAAELALERGDPTAAEAHLEELLRQVGPDGGANAMCAALLVKCLEARQDPTERQRLGGRAVALLDVALQKDELSRAQAGSGTFAPLRGRADYEALLDK